MDIFEKLTKFVQQVFKTTVDVFLEALKLSPNAQGYVLGSITELLLKEHLEALGFEVKRIREKWEGTKHPNHHGDFYFRKADDTRWFVLESKGIKSNSEKWHKLYNLEKLKKFLIQHSDKICWINANQNIEEQVLKWLQNNLPKFFDEYALTLYEYEEIQNYLKSPPKRETQKSKAIAQLKGFTREQINRLIDERLRYVMSKVRVLETHFVSGTSGSSERTQATPRKDEFNVVSVDVVLRYPEHKFLFANPNHLESSGKDANHLQQNYIIGFVFLDSSRRIKLSLTEEWTDDFMNVYETLGDDESVLEEDMQVDNRYMLIRQDDE
ncbi:MAG: hypothetical protein D6732_02710 [Methanobacteriota archaeon]|nr:MAG: hypothetical protein D6732_02710 [Euryarchaeota archaeon]